ncbi:MAG: hypothetical protein ABIR33_11385 [Pyrinomonadaceae bacterium]
MSDELRTQIVSAVHEAIATTLSHTRTPSLAVGELSVGDALAVLETRSRCLDGLIPLIIGETHQARRMDWMRRNRIRSLAHSLGSELGADVQRVEDSLLCELADFLY